MTTRVTYKTIGGQNLDVLSPDPTAAGADLIQDNAKAIAEICNTLATSIAAAQAMLTALSASISNVNNTSDANKPISTATQAALNLKATTAQLASLSTSISNAGYIGRGGGEIDSGDLYVSRGSISADDSIGISSGAGDGVFMNGDGVETPSLNADSGQDLYIFSDVYFQGSSLYLASCQIQGVSAISFGDGTTIGEGGADFANGCTVNLHGGTLDIDGGSIDLGYGQINNAGNIYSSAVFFDSGSVSDYELQTNQVVANDYISPDYMSNISWDGSNWNYSGGGIDLGGNNLSGVQDLTVNDNITSSGGTFGGLDVGGDGLYAQNITVYDDISLQNTSIIYCYGATIDSPVLSNIDEIGFYEGASIGVSGGYMSISAGSNGGTPNGIAFDSAVLLGSGNLNCNGNQIDNFRPGEFTTSTLPSASASEGVILYDATAKAFKGSNGTSWMTL